MAFGIARDILGGSTSTLELASPATIKHLKEVLVKRYPEFMKLKSFSVAVNEEYQEDDFILSEQDEIVILPPVSGG